MRKHSLSENGLSMSQAQSISNLLYQRAREIQVLFLGINNCSKTFAHEGRTYTQVKGVPLPGNVASLLMEKASIHGVQGFLMENIKAKEELLISLMQKRFEFEVEAPVYPNLIQPKLLRMVGEDFGWAQLSLEETNEFLEQEAIAAHVGEFIHKGGVLDKLRGELATLKPTEFIQIESTKSTPITVSAHHTPEQLFGLHRELSELHRKAEQRVNYFKAKVKNLAAQENIRIHAENQKLQAEANQQNDKLLQDYREANQKYAAQFEEARLRFEEQRQKELKEASALRIAVDPRFKPVIDEYMKSVLNEDTASTGS